MPPKEKEVKWEELRGKPKWLVISGKVYDISDFLDEHPGGKEVMLERFAVRQPRPHREQLPAGC